MATYRNRAIGSVLIANVFRNRGIGTHRIGGTFRNRAAGTFQVGDDAVVETPTTFTPSALEALSHEIFNDVGLDPDLFGEDIEYRCGDGSVPSIIKAIVQFDQQSVRIDTDGKRRVRQGTVFISYTNAIGVSAPTRKDTFVFRGEEFSISDIGERQGGCWSMNFVRTESQEKTSIKRRFI